jgi:hypothetical protein
MRNCIFLDGWFQTGVLYGVESTAIWVCHLAAKVILYNKIKPVRRRGGGRRRGSRRGFRPP